MEFVGDRTLVQNFDEIEFRERDLQNLRERGEQIKQQNILFDIIEQEKIDYWTEKEEKMLTPIPVFEPKEEMAPMPIYEDVIDQPSALASSYSRSGTFLSTLAAAIPGFAGTGQIGSSLIGLSGPQGGLGQAGMHAPGPNTNYGEAYSGKSFNTRGGGIGDEGEGGPGGPGGGSTSGPGPAGGTGTGATGGVGIGAGEAP